MIDVLFALLPTSLILDWAGPAEALRIANRHLVAQGQPARFRLRFVGPRAAVTSSVGVQLAGIEPLHAGQLELITFCAGSVIAAHAGLLAERRATTHHQHLDELTRTEPRCDVVANRVFVEDGAVFSSAGVTTGIDLFLHRISAVCGAPLAAQLAQSMVVALRRGPNDPELSPFLAYRNHLHPALQSGKNVSQAAKAAGFTSDTQLRRTMLAQHQSSHEPTASRTAPPIPLTRHAD